MFFTGQILFKLSSISALIGCLKLSYYKVDYLSSYRHKDDKHTLLLEGEIFREVPAFVISTQHKQRRRVNDFQRPQIEHALQHSKHTNDELKNCNI